MATLVLFTSSAATSSQVLPALSLVDHLVRVLPASADAAADAPEADLWLLDAQQNLVAAKTLCKILAQTAPCPLLVIVGPEALVALGPDWGFADFLLTTVGPSELQARLLLQLASGEAETKVVTASGIEIDEGTYAARLHGRTLDLTYTEFELLKFLARHPGRVFSRQQLVSDVWGYDYFGGTRTVDVHVRRLRAKLGPEHEGIIETVRNVGYRLVATAPN